MDRRDAPQFPQYKYVLRVLRWKVEIFMYEFIERPQDKGFYLKICVRKFSATSLSPDDNRCLYEIFSRTSIETLLLYHFVMISKFGFPYWHAQNARFLIGYLFSVIRGQIETPMMNVWSSNTKFSCAAKPSFSTHIRIWQLEPKLSYHPCSTYLLCVGESVLIS